MISRTTERFRKAFEHLPEQVQRQARAAYGLFQQDPQHPSLRFRQVHPTRLIFSARIGLNYRALGLRIVASERRGKEAAETVEEEEQEPEDEIVWFWIGSHAEYDELLDHL